ncbi:MAG: hypothetical protein QOG89_1101 [Thermomicrobiales bacterium]|nr:hypothetical protein [Thermomicrobiales bacterium]
MKGPETRTDVLATLFVEQALWEALLDDVGEAQMDEPGCRERGRSRRSPPT